MRTSASEPVRVCMPNRVTQYDEVVLVSKSSILVDVNRGYYEGRYYYVLFASRMKLKFLFKKLIFLYVRLNVIEMMLRLVAVRSLA